MASRVWSVIASIAVATMAVSGSITWEMWTDNGPHRDGGGFYDPGTVPNGALPPVPDVTPPDEPPTPGTPPAWSYGLPLFRADVLALADVSSHLHLTVEQEAFLMANGMVGVRKTPEVYDRFADAYDWIDHSQLPMFITSDSVLDAFHHHYLNVLKQVEGGALKEQLRVLSERMVTLSERQRATLSPEMRALAEQNMAYFGIALRLLDPNATFAGYVLDDIDSTVRKIESAEGTMLPPGFSTIEDLTQYVPRGHYTASEGLSRYFRAMMWYGRLTFRGDVDDETRRAVMASIALSEDHVASASYARIRTSIGFLVGMPDDLTPTEYSSEARAVMGNLSHDLTPLFDDAKLDELQVRLERLRPPQVESDITPPGVDIWGLRMLGQASVLDSYIFKRCTSEEVPHRYNASGLDVMAALGSDEALSREPLDKYSPELGENLGQLRDELGAKNGSFWSSNVYSSWLHILQALDNDTWKGSLPAFMGTDAWAAKQLNTQLASWTQLCHDTQLYRKQTYVYQGWGDPFFTYVEPVPIFFWRLAIAVEYLDATLSSLELGTDTTHKELRELDSALRLFYALAINQLDSLEMDEETMIDARESYKEMVWGDWNKRDVSEGDTVVVADVYTVHNAEVVLRFLEEGVGLIRFVVVVAPSADGPIACIGPVFEHYEFERGAQQGRLTDEEWQAMLAAGTAPEPAQWAQDFIL